MARVGPVEFGVGVVGVGLVVAGVRNVSPVSVIRSVLDPDFGPPTPIHTAPPAAPSTAGQLPAGGAAGESRPLPEMDPDNLVDYTNPETGDQYSGITIRVTPDTLRGIEAWNAAYGRRIAFTSGYRSAADQARSAAQNPNRYAPADKSWHVRGRAVDVHLAASGAGNELGLRRLHSTGEATGWCFAGRSGPMHASYGGCG